MSFSNMLEIALIVANDVWEYDRDTVEYMCDESEAEVVIDFFHSHEDKFGSDCSLQIAFAAQYLSIKEAEE